MGNPSSASQEPPAASSSGRPTTLESDERSPPFRPIVMRFLESVGLSKNPIAENYSSEDFYSDLLCNGLKVHTVRRGHVTCFTTVKPTISNFYGMLHGSAVAAIAERVAIATAKTVVGEDKDMFLGELAMSYLSSAAIDAELIVEGSVVRSGRNLTVTLVEFKMRKTGELVNSCHATFYNSPIAKL
ncbi:Signal recognition particle receptor protein isoform 1 [Hibiscus syriacus]|uniref:Signal recognition particle receptor protein isoform 1 n=1 Tax=Hibiscus syriacus TaxID=106335 RepID=A0A6A2ZRN9_HIBSY|nr:uncharacterized protein LOC120141094 [Hibiscus syriacus]KAE8693812.1 Signal recognition particle receptor protein isoform 1 [Hibiscus syriacus]